MSSETPSEAKLILPDNFDSDAWEIRAKGCFFGAFVRVNGQDLPITFYDPIRLQQDVDAELRTDFVSLPERTVVLQEVTRKNMEAFVASYQWDRGS